MHILQVVTGLPPLTDGIGDYALKLATPLRAEHGLETHFLVVDPAWKGGAVSGFTATAVESRSPTAFLDAVARIEREAGQGQMQILLQFSPYGYEKRGCPFWFADAIEKLDRQRPGWIHGAFHELENHNWRPWNSAFWVSGVQRNLLQRVARVCRFRYTNTEFHRRKLEEWGLGRFDLIPNFSTMGEPSEYPSFEHRRSDLIVFGRGAQRRWTYQHGARTIGPLCTRIGATRIVDIGEPLTDMQATDIGGIPLVRRGRLPEEEVDAAMATSLASFTYYPVQHILKSSVFAVSAAFGTIPFIYDDQRRPQSCPGLVTGEDFIPVSDDLRTLRLPSMEELSRTVFVNYQKRNLRTAAAFLAKQLRALAM